MNCRDLQKNWPQANSLMVATFSSLISGLHIGFGILNFSLDLQEWAWQVSQSGLYIVTVTWYVGAILGLILGRFFVRRQDKITIGYLALGIYFLSGLLAVISPTEALSIGTSRTLAGIAHGFIYITAIVHASEIAVKEIRGLLLANLQICTYIGIFIYSLYTVNVTKSLDPNVTTGIVSMLFAVAGSLSYFFTYESPVFLLQRNWEGEAKLTMMKLRSETTETPAISMDFLELKTMIVEDERLSSSILKNGNVRPLAIMAALRILAVMSFNLPLNYVRAVFIIPHIGLYVSVLISGLRVFSSLISLFMLDRLPRRKLFLPSAIPPCMSMLFLSILYVTGVFEIGDIGPLISICVFDFTAGFSVAQLTSILSAEAFALPKKIDSLLITIALEYTIQIIMCLSMMSIVVMEQGPILAIQFASVTVMLICTGCLIKFMPETQGKSIRETRDLFRGYGADVSDFMS